jgi:hypothetical protein
MSGLGDQASCCLPSGLCSSFIRDQPLQGSGKVERSQNLTLSPSCVVSYPLFKETNQPKAPADKVVINIDIFLKKKKVKRLKGNQLNNLEEAE